MTAMSDPTTKARIVVIGGGFSGAVFSLHLARKATRSCTITVVEPREKLGAGVAYGTPDPAHRINVPAARMIVFPEAPTDFDSWFRSGAELVADPEALWSDGHAYPRRSAFGRYIAATLASAAASRPDITISHHQGAATAVRRHDHRFTIHLEDGTILDADLIVLAVSHPPPTVPALVTTSLGTGPDIIADPWAPDALATVTPSDDVLVIGTGLTMADVIASLGQRGHHGNITAFSRRGLLSRGHACYTDPYTWFGANDPPLSALALLRKLRALIAEAAKDGVPWQAVIDDVRAHGRRVWRSLPALERSRLLRHLRPFWDVHRYRIAPQAEAAIGERLNEGSLRVLAASLRSLQRKNGKIIASLRPRHGAEGACETVTVDKIIVTTGPAHDSVISANPALSSLSKAGLLTPDPLGLGIAVNAISEVIAADGSTTDTLLVAGPLAREQYGELMGLPQVSAHALEIAEKVALWLVLHR